MTPAFTLDSVDTHYGGVQALTQASLTVLPGDRVALVGPNGSGKSTLLRLMHGLMEPTSGAITRIDPARQAMLFQRPYMLRMSAVRNVELALLLRGFRRSEIRDRSMHALDRVGMVKLAHRNARALSGGQLQRLALARAWALNPDVLLLDEPTASLDPRARQEVEALMEEFAQSAPAAPVTMIFSSHNLAQVHRLARRVVYLEQGRILADLSVDEFFAGTISESVHLFVQGELL